MRANFRNRTLYHGDNLKFLRGMNSETVDLVATDPPFNKGRDFHATPDSLAAGAKFHDRWSWEDDVEGEWIDQIKTDWPAVQEVIDATNHTWGEDMGAFLCYMGVRLLEMHRLLKPTGSLYLHCDDTASAYLTMMLDAIFGRRNRKNEIVWRRTKGRSDAQRFGRAHDNLLYYAKDTKQAIWNQPLGAHDPNYVKRAYRHEDERGRWRSDQLTASDRRTGESGQPWRGIDVDAKGNHWRTPTQGGMNDYIREHNLIPGWPDAYPSVHRRLDALDAAGLIHWPKKPGGMPSLKRYLDSTKGTAVDSIWDDISRLEAVSEENTGYATQKPVDLYKRIILASSNPGDVVLDPFCGCATTLIAAEQEGRQWIGMDLWDEALTVVQGRLDKECGNIEQGKLWSGAIFTTDTPPPRTDDGAIAAPPLKTKKKGAMRSPEPGPVLPRAEMIALLIKRQEGKCAGCNRRYEDERIWQIDHLNPRSAGGVNHDSNRCLLCPPCNGIKSDTMTLTALRKHNAKNGLMA